MPSLTFGSLGFLHRITRIPSSHSEEVHDQSESIQVSSFIRCIIYRKQLSYPSVPSKPLLYYNRHAEASQPRITDASPTLTLAAAPVYVDEADGLELESELDDDNDVVTELAGVTEPAAGDGVITGTAEEAVVSVATEKVV